MPSGLEFDRTADLLDGEARRDRHPELAGARELLGQLSPAPAMRRWMDSFGDWIATKNGMLDTLLAMIESGKIAHTQTRTELLAAITTILDAGHEAGDLRSDAQAGRLLNLLMDAATRSF